MNFKSELKVDFETFRKHTDTPIFHRLKFDKTSIYLTKSTFYDLLVSKNDHGHYRIFSWDDWRAKKLLGFELGDASPKLGIVNLIGHYTPSQNDLTEVQYISEKGKAYYDSAKDELEGLKDGKRKRQRRKIDSREFMRMGEIIPTGIQGKAICGEGNYIIDGAAGTGKSTTVLQKIRLLNKHNRVPLDRILVLVKNKSVIKEFDGLLKKIGVTGLRITTIDNFESSLFNKNEDIDFVIDRTWSAASQLNECVITLEKEKKLLSNRIFSTVEKNDKDIVGGNDKYILKAFGKDLDLIRLFREYNKQRGRFIDLLKENNNEKSSDKKQKEKELKDYEDLLIRQLQKKKNGPFINKMLNFVKKVATLTLGEEAKIRDLVAKKKKELDSKTVELSDKHKKNEEKAIRNLDIVIKNIRKRILSKVYSDIRASDDRERMLLSLHIKKMLGGSVSFHTIIVDEAQDASLSKIHLAWLNAENTILTGDELQKEALDGIGYWNNLGKLEKEFSKNGQKNMFTLRHNFRQTFELGNFVFNFRQLVLGKPIIDIQDEYFENQKGFSKPQLKTIGQPSDFINIVNDKIKLIDKTFSDTLPVVIFYENEVMLNNLKEMLGKENIQYGYDGDESKTIMFVDIKNISGRSFPVVMMPLTSTTNENLIYIMISRAKYDLCIFAGKEVKINKHIERLLSEKIIVRYPKSPSERYKYETERN